MIKKEFSYAINVCHQCDQERFALLQLIVFERLQSETRPPDRPVNRVQRTPVCRTQGGEKVRSELRQDTYRRQCGRDGSIQPQLGCEEEAKEAKERIRTRRRRLRAGGELTR